MFALIFILLFVCGLIGACVYLLRSSAKQKKQWDGPRDLHRADDVERGAAFEQEKSYRAAQDASNWGSPGW